MSEIRPTNRLWLVVVLCVSVLLLGARVSEAAPVKELIEDRYGEDVNATTTGNFCSIKSGNICQPGHEGAAIAGYASPESVAVATSGNIYVADTGNNRVQEITPAGEFVLMFGADVNKTTKGNICTDEEVLLLHVECNTGSAGTDAGEMNGDFSIAIDPADGNVYVLDEFNNRVDEYTADGDFVLMFGDGVNRTKDAVPTSSEAERNVCTAASGDLCGQGVQNIGGNLAKKGAFSFSEFRGNLLAIGGSTSHLLYVGDAYRVQEFEASSTNASFVGEIDLTGISATPGSKVTALAANEAGDIYLVYRTEGAANTVRKYDAAGNAVAAFEVKPRKPEARMIIQGLALEASGHLAVVGQEVTSDSAKRFGFLYEAATGHLLTEFANPAVNGLAFGTDETMYGAVSGGSGAGHEVLGYMHVLVAELQTQAEACSIGADRGTSATVVCELHGTVNTEGVANTTAWFDWSESPSLELRTAREPILTESEGISSRIEGLRPNEHIFYDIAGEDENSPAPEELSGETIDFITPSVAPRVSGVPTSSFIGPFSADLYTELNPENALTRYGFEYVAQADFEQHGWANADKTLPGESSVYGLVGVTEEASGLQPATTYRFRLIADNEFEQEGRREGGIAVGPEGAFTTLPVPMPVVMTGGSSALTATSAVVSGSVNPDGQPATYSFEVGVYDGAATQYGVVFSGSIGSGTTPVEESFTLTGLQPGTTYAYRIIVKSGYGEAVGEPVTFTTQGLPPVLEVPLAIGPLQFSHPPFPTEPKSTKGCKKGFRLDTHGKCVAIRKKKVTHHKKKRKAKKK